MARNYHETLNHLLNKAERTDNEPEREALLDKVAHLMQKHAIDEALFTAQRQALGTQADADEIIQVTISYEGQYAQSLQWWTSTIGSTFDCGTLWHPDKSSRTRRTTYLYGYRSDVEAVQTLIDSLRLQMVRPLKEYQREQGTRYYPTTVAAFIERRAFVKAFAQGAASKLNNERTAIVAAASASSGMELVLFDRKAAVVKHVQQHTTGKGSANRVSGGVGDGASRGREAGRRADVTVRAQQKRVSA